MGIPKPFRHGDRWRVPVPTAAADELRDRLKQAGWATVVCQLDGDPVAHLEFDGDVDIGRVAEVIRQQPDALSTDIARVGSDGGTGR